LLQAREMMMRIARAGYEMVVRQYSKQMQWSAFEALVSNA
jgi:hypothetical protein